MQRELQARKLHVEGLVQGVGFRPFVYRLARDYEIKGWVSNTNEGVDIWAEGTAEQLELFTTELTEQSPKASSVHSLDTRNRELRHYEDFFIAPSRSDSDQITQVSPDIAVCEECLADMKTQPHRLEYPLINCTHCGPRFTIIRELPYDRPYTTMAPFTMCEQCRSEYETIEDRRFHAQPVACNRCGPEYAFYPSDQSEPVTGITSVLQQCSELIGRSGVIAIKGTGGFHLMGDAADEKAVARLRDIKLRSGKPFAVMVRDEQTAGRIADLSQQEAELLTSWRRPIVLTQQRGPLAPSVNPGFSTVGLILPHMPFHYQLFEWLDTDAVVLTSGNLSDEPIVIDNRRALETFAARTDAVVTYNRDIHNRADDSVAFACRNKPRLIRRSKGYVPQPVKLGFQAEGILAVGAELNHCFAVGKGDEAIISQHIGDLKDPPTYAFFEESVERFRRLFRGNPVCVACDRHPEYLSTDYARRLEVPGVEVQHHHAHVAAAMAEYHLRGPVIGICWDGTGLGTDDRIWGGEFLYADLSGFKRFSHFAYLPMPGGDKAAEEPWRMAVAYLYSVMGSDFTQLDLPFVREVRRQPGFDLLVQGLEQHLNAPLTSAAGRLFDAVAALTGICNYNSFHAEAPMKLEAIIDPNAEGIYSFDFNEDGVISFAPTIRGVITDIQQKVPAAVISARFHNTLVEVITTVAKKMQLTFTCNKVILTGGVFQNRYLLEQAEQKLENSFEVYIPEQVPCNDAGIALGQLAVAAHRNQNSYTS